MYYVFILAAITQKNMTDLKTFVSETIQQVIEGTKDAGQYLKENIDYKSDGFVQVGEGFEKIEFDISVTTSETSKSEGKAGIMIKVVDFGIKGTENTQATSMNKIRFSVPVIFPKISNQKK